MGKNEQHHIDLIVTFLTCTCNIDRDLIKREHYIVMYRGKVIGLFPQNPNNILHNTGMRVNQPDITILDGNGGIMMVIEIDGSIHEEYAQRRTRHRNLNYSHNGIHTCIINVRKFREQRKNWFLHVQDAVNECAGVVRPIPVHTRKRKMTRPQYRLTAGNIPPKFRQ